MDEEAKKQELFKAAVTGEALPFMSVPLRQLLFINDEGRSLLHVAVCSGSSQLVRLLIEKKIHEMEVKVVKGREKVVHWLDFKGFAPLHYAVMNDHFDLVDLLVTQGKTAVDFRNSDGRTSLHLAASRGLDRIAQHLISHGAQINKRDLVGATPLHRAACGGKLDMCNFLISMGASIDKKNKLGHTPLMNAVMFGNKEVVTQLIRSGADVRAVDEHDRNASDRASKEMTEVIEAILYEMLTIDDN